MRLVFHGGKCCGVRHILYMGTNPDEYVDAEDEKIASIREHDKNGAEVKSDLDFFTKAAPHEPAHERLDRLLEFCRKHRRQGVVEIILAESIHSWMDQMRWKPELEKRGFKLVTSAKNSNSGNTIHIFHLVTE